MRRLPGTHVPNIKNRSSKHLSWLTGFKPAVRSMSNAMLNEMSGKDAANERRRRLKKQEKKDMKA